MTPLLIVALPAQQSPLVWWASDAYVIAASSRLDDMDLSFDEAWHRYAERHDRAHCFRSQDEARQWAETYDGPHWLEVRAEIARAGAKPPQDLAFAE